MNDLTAIELLKTGSVIDFKITKSDVMACTDNQEAHSVATLMMLDDDEEEGYQSVEWGAFGFIYCLATLSFSDAKPRNSSELDYDSDDEFTVGDMVSCLSFENGKLRFYGDYLKGRLVKTRITIEPNGKVEVETVCRGNALSIWLQKLQGKKTLQSI